MLSKSKLSQIDSLDQIDIYSVVDERIKEKKTGFLEELKASLSVIRESWISTVFYIILFLMLLCLELFVVSLKLFKSKKGDYVLISDYQQEAKRIQIENAKRDLIQHFHSETIETDEK